MPPNVSLCVGYVCVCVREREKESVSGCVSVRVCDCVVRVVNILEILQYTATQCNILQNTATHYNILQRTTTHCNGTDECF